MFVFMVMPFEIEDIFEKHIKPLLEAEGCEVVRGDTHDLQGNIVKDILEYLYRADLVIIDLTGRNPNVFYELALAQAFLKPTFVITKDDLKNLPFDVSNYRAHKYSLAPTDIDELKSKLLKYVKMFQDGKLKPQSPLIDFLPNYRPPINNQDQILEQLQNINAAYVRQQDFQRTKKYELAIRLDMVAREIRDAFINARSPLGYNAPEYKPNSTQEQKKQQDNAYDRKWRLEPIVNAMDKLYAIRSEYAILFNGVNSLEAPIDMFNKKFHQLDVNLALLHNNHDRDKVMGVVFRSWDTPDKFAEEIDEATNKLIEIAQQSSF